MRFDAKALRAVALVLLVLAVVAEVLALRASGEAAQIQGPQALLTLRDGQVWVHVDAELWRVGADGRLLGRDPVAGLGLPGAPAQMVAVSPDEVLAVVRDQPTLYWLSTLQPHVTRGVTPQWPADLQRHAARAIQIAAHPDGRVAIATGGGHVVALFDAEGRFIARTAPGTYHFTNGLWWDGDALWTTDTNRFRLKRLDGRSLRVEQEVPLAPSPGQPFLGSARALDAPGTAWQAALLRLDASMRLGHVVALDRQGRETAFSQGSPLEPRDLAWQGEALLVSDAQSRTVLRWARPDTPPEAFGDADLRALWQTEGERRVALERQYRWGMGAAIACFAAGVMVALWLARRSRGAPVPAGDPRFAQVGTPLLPRGPMLRLWWRAFGWMSVFVVVLGLARWPGAMAQVRAWGGLSAVVTVLALMMVTLAVSLFLGLRHVGRVARAEAFEPVFNIGARQWLGRSAVLAQALDDDEVVHEVFGWADSARRVLVALTDRRLLLVRPGLSGETLEATHALADVKAVSTEPARVGRLEAHLRWAARWRSPRGWLELRLNNDVVLAGSVSSPTVAQRSAARIQAAIGNTAKPMPPGAPSPAQRPQGSRRAHQPAAAIASLLLPGLGQWWQRRTGAALAFFVPWASAMALWVIPVVWTLAGPRAAVSPTAALVAAYFGALWPAGAAWEAWRGR